MISGFIAKDPATDKLLCPKDGFFVYTKKHEDKIKEKLVKLKKKFKKIPKFRFDTRISVPEAFAPTVVGNYSKGFAGLTLAKMLNKIEKAEKEEKKSKSPKSRSPR